MRSLGRFVTPPDTCAYLPEQQSRLEYELVTHATPAEYGARLRGGWRRFGYAWFRPVCASCSACQSLRIPAAAFTPDRSQRRAWNAGRQSVRVVVGAPSASADKRRLFDAFHQHQTLAKGWPESQGDYDEMFVRNPFPTEEWCYFAGSELVGVGYFDRLPDGLSAIYCFYDPQERRRSLGTFNILSAIAEARSAGLPYVYLGYYVKGNRSLEYKARFQPNEVIAGEAWRPFLSRG